MNRKRVYVLMTLMLLLVLSGCSLAKEDAGKEIYESEEIVQDRLIGVLVTDEHQDLFDIESFLNDNLNEIVDGEVLEENGSNAYQERIYATIEKNGSDVPDEWDFYFQGIEGYAYFSPTMQHGEGEPFVMLVADDCFSDISRHYVVTDDGEEIYLEGTLYLQAGKGQTEAFFLNPVYQTEDGEIYLIGGNGIGSNVLWEDGNEMSDKIEGTYNYTVGGVEESYKGSVEIKFVTVNAPEKIKFYHMSEKHEILKVEEFSPEEVPEDLQTEKGTAYVLMENEIEDEAGTIRIERKLCEPDAEGQMTVKIFHPSENGILIPKYVSIIF